MSSVTLATEQWPEPTAETERIFRHLADGWLHDVAYASDKHTMVTHPYYLQIIGLGPPAVRLLLRELEQAPSHWLWALQAITRQDPAGGLTSLRPAIAAGFDWGRSQGLLAQMRPDARRAMLRQGFPGLIDENSGFTSTADAYYNCFAWAAEDDQNWWQPEAEGGYDWPPGVPQASTLESYVAAYGSLGYSVCESAMLEQDYQKIAPYVS